MDLLSKLRKVRDIAQERNIENIDWFDFELNGYELNDFINCSHIPDYRLINIKMYDTYGRYYDNSELKMVPITGSSISLADLLNNYPIDAPLYKIITIINGKNENTMISPNSSIKESIISVTNLSNSSMLRLDMDLDVIITAVEHRLLNFCYYNDIDLDEIIYNNEKRTMWLEKFWFPFIHTLTPAIIGAITPVGVLYLKDDDNKVQPKPNTLIMQCIEYYDPQGNPTGKSTCVSKQLPHYSPLTLHHKTTIEPPFFTVDHLVKPFALPEVP